MRPIRICTWQRALAGVWLAVAGALPAVCFAGSLAWGAFAEAGADLEDGKLGYGAGLALRHATGFGVELSAQRLNGYAADTFVRFPPSRNPTAVSLTSPRGDSVALLFGYRHEFPGSRWFGTVLVGAHRWSHDITVATEIGDFVVDSYTQDGIALAAGVELGWSFSDSMDVSLAAKHFESPGPDQERVCMRLAYTF